ncbi:MAG: YraN family protein [Ignavibacteria bacterium RIFOXYB2_FULL_35_12]|nr:MAG: YraN family protein [Ignavibacteria bacterium GWA2_36_19]OGU50050.1 MAG: YraN family protein [Ignavibacteria bacterium GWC2_35_8]OGU63029.1 MAG: YraN family protein [Ignavibacteria bacterium GWF2_35_20]OGU80265.1 MAG: YraN family protein [Ignavibacteria bacterium RIFOXYA2_FULL_35_9]OGU88983.1 MAG: YraN family protein [Ignavibacteria bacterium RIFOXYA12_FULL_35_25]OGU90922.1 MAG: YraN family protein [Ignavibacteria bacterium RIFOXYC12_FULL_35_11]OGU94882.1 MAG: YraN family protein [Ign
MTFSTKKTGDKGEELAVELLESKSYTIIKRNYRYGKGEIDIIAKDPQEEGLVFIEVKSRKSLEYGSPEEAITKNKIKQLKRIAELYLYENEIKEILCRFDVIAILMLPGEKPQIEHYVNAFD